MTGPQNTAQRSLLPVLAAVALGVLVVGGIALWPDSNSNEAERVRTEDRSVQTAEPEPHRMADHRMADYRRAVNRAIAWVDALEIDPKVLQEQGVKGTKKLAEALAFYALLIRYEEDADERQRLQQRFRDLAAATNRTSYHNLETCSDKEFHQNSMSYLRVMWLMDRAGLDISKYRAAVKPMKSRLDAHMARRGHWQRAMFARYYDDFDLEKPPLLQGDAVNLHIVESRVPFEQLDLQRSYQLTHEVFVKFDYGFSDEQEAFGPADLEYLEEVLPQLIDRNIELGNSDLLGELVTSMTLLGFRRHPAVTRGIDYLLDHQNPTGTWGDYEDIRAKMGDLVDAHAYLHTTLAVVQALVETYERPSSH